MATIPGPSSINVPESGLRPNGTAVVIDPDAVTPPMLATRTVQVIDSPGRGRAGEKPSVTVIPGAVTRSGHKIRRAQF